MYALQLFTHMILMSYIQGIQKSPDFLSRMRKVSSDHVILMNHTLMNHLREHKSHLGVVSIFHHFENLR